MRKLLFAAAAILSFAVAGYAMRIESLPESPSMNISESGYYMPGGVFTAWEDGVRYAAIEISDNGSCTLLNYEEGWVKYGTYNVQRQVVPGDQSRITFVIDGQTYYGDYLWPVEGKRTIVFDGWVFEFSGR